MINKNFIRFILVGACSTGIDFVIYFILSFFVNVSVSKCISMTVACTFSFFINKRWTFADKEGINVRKVSKFIVVQLINICVNTGANTGLFHVFHRKIMAFILATGTAMVVNYLLQKYIVFTGGDNK